MKIKLLNGNLVYELFDGKINQVQYSNWEGLKKTIKELQQKNSKYILYNENNTYEANEINVIEIDELKQGPNIKKEIKSIIKEIIKKNDVDFKEFNKLQSYMTELDDDTGLIKLNNIASNGNKGVYFEYKPINLETFIETMDLNYEDVENYILIYINLNLLKNSKKINFVVFSEEVKPLYEKWINTYKTQNTVFNLINNEKQYKNISGNLQFLVKEKSLEKIEVNDVDKYTYALTSNIRKKIEYQEKNIQKTINEIYTINKNIHFIQEKILHNSHLNL